MKIDAEVYFWKYEQSFEHSRIRINKILQQSYLPEQISQSFQRNGVDGCVGVVAENAEVQTRFLAELALTHPEIRGIVGWIDLHDSRAVDKIRELNHYISLRGYVIESGNAPSIGSAVMESLYAYQYSLDLTLKMEKDLSTLNNWIASLPEQSFILRNCGYPEVSMAPSEDWKANIQQLAKNKNLACKLSGLFTQTKGKNWKAADFYPFLEILFEAFGCERLLFASEWPFVLLSGIYIQWKSLIEKFMEKYTAEERDNIFGENARRFYRI